MVSPTDPSNQSYARQARELFVVHMGRALPDVVRACDVRLNELINLSGSPRDVQLRRDVWGAFQKAHAAWMTEARNILKKRVQARSGDTGPSSLSGQLELVDEHAIDDQIMASRLAMRLLDKTSSELNELRLRIQYLEKRSELSKNDLLLPEVMCKVLVDAWSHASLPREGFGLVQDAVAAVLADKLLEGYKAANQFLVAGGVMRKIDLQALVRRSPGGKADAPAPFRRVQEPPSSGPPSSRSGAMSSGMDVHEETRMLTGTSPLARARMRAQGVVGRLRRLISDRVGGDWEATQLLPPNPALQQALQRPLSVPSMGASLYPTGSSGPGAVYVDAGTVERTAVALRQRTTELKQAANTPSEKATIEVVALMFQAILAEERIPPSVRVWFARLQIPVLRVALAEPEFFSALQHPARRLIDRMGSCVLGFDANVNAPALEAEIKRVVQVIEQYPETGRRVFQLVYDEFQKFLANYLTEQTSASRVVSVAQQVEQKETLSVQYTIELRKLLEDMPVRHEVRDFLFKVWADVLAVSSVKHGVKHPDTQALKQVASDLLWAASAKPNRDDRARVIQQLPGILQRLRQGMGLLGFPQALQDQHIKSVSDTLADAFMSRTEPIAQDQLDVLARRLANLEDYLPDGGVGDFDLNPESIELITGVDAANIQVINQGGSQPNEAMRAWAMELQIGSWFGLDYLGRLHNVQLAWRSQHGQLFMFVSGHGRCYLMQLSRVAAYLQAGLLLPSEEEALTVRATREALAKLDANPERLLA